MCTAPVKIEYLVYKDHIPEQSAYQPWADDDHMLMYRNFTKEELMEIIDRRLNVLITGSGLIDHAIVGPVQSTSDAHSNNGVDDASTTLSFEQHLTVVSSSVMNLLGLVGHMHPNETVYFRSCV